MLERVNDEKRKSFAHKVGKEIPEKDIDAVGGSGPINDRTTWTVTTISESIHKADDEWLF